MNPFLTDANETRKRHQEVLREVEHERFAVQFTGNPSRMVVRALPGLGALLILLIAAGQWLG